MHTAGLALWSSALPDKPALSRRRSDCLCARQQCYVAAVSSALLLRPARCRVACTKPVQVRSTCVTKFASLFMHAYACIVGYSRLCYVAYDPGEACLPRHAKARAACSCTSWPPSQGSGPHILLVSKTKHLQMLAHSAAQGTAHPPLSTPQHAEPPGCCSLSRHFKRAATLSAVGLEEQSHGWPEGCS